MWCCRSGRPSAATEAQAGPLPESIVDRSRPCTASPPPTARSRRPAGSSIDGKFVGATRRRPEPGARRSRRRRSTRCGSRPATSPTGRASSRSTPTLANDNDLKVGQQVGLQTLQGTEQVTLVGIADYGTSNSLGGAALMVITFADAQRGTTGWARSRPISVKADKGVTPLELKQRIEQVVRRTTSRCRPATRPPRSSPTTSPASSTASCASLLLGVRRSGGARRRVHHLQHLLDHGRPAHARVRDAAHHRRDPPPGAELGAG